MEKLIKELYQHKAYAIIQHMQLVARELSPETVLSYEFGYSAIDEVGSIIVTAKALDFNVKYSLNDQTSTVITIERFMATFFKMLENYAAIFAEVKKTCSTCDYGGCFSHCECKLSPFYVEEERRETFDRPLDPDGTCQYWKPTDKAKQFMMHKACSLICRVDLAADAASFILQYSPNVGILTCSTIEMSDNAAGSDKIPDRSRNENAVKLWDIANSLGVSTLVLPILEDARFGKWSGSSKPSQHHYGMGGLAAHTLEVVELCMLVAKKHYKNEVDLKLLFLAAMYHDAGKMYDYSPTREDMSEWTSNYHKYRIHHVSRSAMMWTRAASASGMAEWEIDEVTHAILSHHGQREWGSPVQPATKLAWILHTCDMMSARVNDCDKQ